MRDGAWLCVQQSQAAGAGCSNQPCRLPWHREHPGPAANTSILSQHLTEKEKAIGTHWPFWRGARSPEHHPGPGCFHNFPRSFFPRGARGHDLGVSQWAPAAGVPQYPGLQEWSQSWALCCVVGGQGTMGRCWDKRGSGWGWMPPEHHPATLWAMVSAEGEQGRK